ncbi:helix-turn-helix transcriptional regulator [Microvirga sp. M2]|uniref:helix-turn-helix transcriptional regulator n=1 Tax=Microvirga sp. M2 TaxID=3073270 RepID=UPI0039C0A34D
MTTAHPTMHKAKPAPQSRQQPRPSFGQEQSDPHLLRHLRTPEAAHYLGVSVSFLNHARLRGTGPIYKKLSPKLIVYSIEDLRTWANSKSRCSTSTSSPSHP